MTARIVVLLAALLLVAGVAIGAFGAHALRARIAPELLAVFNTGVQYHFVHALGLFAIGLLWLQWPAEGRLLALAASLMLAGVLLFSGSLYVLALTGVRTWGAVTPFGGTAWLLGWAVLAWAAWRHAAA